jgi:hypothetical protein
MVESATSTCSQQRYRYEAQRDYPRLGAGVLAVAAPVSWTHQMQDYIQQIPEFEVEQGAPVRVEKMVAVYTSRDRAISEPMASAGKSHRDCCPQPERATCQTHRTDR